MASQITRQIPEDLDGSRLDKALATLLGVSRSQARELVERGVTVDGRPGGPDTRVSSGETVISERPVTDRALRPEPVSFDVLFEDSHVVVVDKPAGLVVHPGAGQKSGTLAAGLLHRYPEIEGVGAAERWGLVHRLDKDTSGALAVARTAESFEALSDQVRKRTMTRSYLALVDGVPGSPTGAIEAPIGRDPDYPMRRAVVQGGKYARTHFEIEEAFGESRCALLRVVLETGRTHQIRVHLSSIGHPVVGDRTYGKLTAVSSPRPFLHASSLEFTHPLDGRRITVDSPLPADLRTVLDSLGDRV